MDSDVLYYGDNLEILRKHIPDACVDLIYLDPPFNSNRAYNLIFRDERGRPSDAQLTAFEDTWRWSSEHTEGTYAFLTNTSVNRGAVPERLSRLVSALRTTLGEAPLMAYLVEMSVRLVELYRVLKPTGSLYLHCDSAASHYLKLVLDTIFGRDQFVNEIIWKRSSAHSDAKQGARHFGRVTDTILFYAKARDRTWNQLFSAYDPEYVARDYRRVDEYGRRYRISDLTANKGGGDTSYEFRGVRPPTGRYWAYSRTKMERLDAEGRIVQTRPGAFPQYKRFLDEMPGMPVQNLWTDISVINNRSHEKLRYQTQKPLALLERIIEASSNPGDLVLDPFCGCGTAVVAAQKLGRHWIGIDITTLAISIMEKRLRDSFGLTDIQVIGDPKDVAGARRLAEKPKNGRYEFEWWAVGLVDAWPEGREKKKGADRGIDGRITFTADRKGGIGSVLVSVKSGKVDVSMIRDLRGTVEREHAAMGLFLTLEEPTAPMRQEVAAAGTYHAELWNRDYPKLQILTIRELLEEHRQPQLPPFAYQGGRKAERLPNASQKGLLGRLAPEDQPEQLAEAEAAETERPRRGRRAAAR